jgi:transcriptional regulator with GAF, ATPase, and Fis domain
MKNNDQLLTFKLIAEATSAVVGKDFFKELVKHFAQVIDVYGAWVTEIMEDQRTLRILAMWLGGEYIEYYEHDMRGTPCESVIADTNGMYHVPDKIIQLFPNNEEFRNRKAVSYMGVALQDAHGTVIGNLAVMDNKPMPRQPRIENIFRIFASRAAAELQRLRAEKHLQENEQRMRRLINGTKDAIIELDPNLCIMQLNDAARNLFKTVNEPQALSLKQLMKLEGLQKVTRVLLQLNEKQTEAPYYWFPNHLECQTTTGDPFPAEATITQCIYQGKHHYILVLRNVLHKLEAEEKIKTLSIETEFLREEIKTIYSLHEIAGSSPPIHKAMHAVRLVGPTDATVLLTGETGTGKELFARAIHNASSRTEKPIVKLNCGALPANLVESELFGHEKGAFTGASSRREGRFALANNGTIFLDEIGEFPLELQPKLLRVLQEGEFEPIGSNTTVKVNVRVIAATNRNLLDEVRKGSFREDLYYRLNVYPIHIPPLRERGDDIVQLAEMFLQQFSKGMHKEIPPLTEKDKQRLLSYPWPGNVRELKNVMERMVITYEGGPFEMHVDNLTASKRTVSISPSSKKILTAPEWRELEKQNILTALKLSHGKISGPDGAAALLDLPPSTLSSRMKALDIGKVYDISLTKNREYT